MEKRHIINALFIISFPIYGIGTYVAASTSPSAGYLVSISAHVAILVFYSIDLLYKKGLSFRLNWVYGFMLLYILSSVASIFVALEKGLPETTMAMTICRTLLLLVPFHAFVAWALYNEGREEDFPRLATWALVCLLLVNLAGYFGLGLINAAHSIEGRLNLPFLDGFYSGAGIIAILNLLLLFELRRAMRNPLQFVLLASFFVVNLYLFYKINSRLAMMIFLILFLLYLFNLLATRGFYLISLFTLPLLLSSGLVLYNLLQLPVLSSLMQRVDIEDVTTFHGRAYLWNDAIDWLLGSREGLILGNGYKGHYFLDLVPDVAKLWDAQESYHLHLHSTSLEILVSQGLIAFTIFCVLFYCIYVYYKGKYLEGKREGAFLPVILFLLFIMQVDTFVYLDGSGFVLFAMLVSRLSISKQRRSLERVPNRSPLRYTRTMAEEITLTPA